MQNRVTEKIAELAESVLLNTNFFLVDVVIKGGNEPVVWVYVDARERGINMDECARFSNELGFLTDAHEIFNGSYRLNVSSPGLDRPLTDWRQYPKNQGRKTKVTFKQNGEYEKAEGVLEKVSEEEIVLKKEDGSILNIGFDQVVETRIIPSIT